MKQAIRAAAVALWCLGWVACTGDGGSSSSSSGTGAASGSSGNSEPCVPVSWSTVSALFSRYCTGCHSANGSAAQYVDLASQSAATADAANIKAYVSAGLMPQDGGIDPADRTTILEWAAHPSGECPGSSTGGSGTTG